MTAAERAKALGIDLGAVQAARRRRMITQMGWRLRLNPNRPAGRIPRCPHPEPAPDDRCPICGYKNYKCPGHGPR